MAIYIDGIYINKKKYSTRVSFMVDKFIPELQKYRNENGYVNILIKETKNDPNKLYAEIDTWQPNNNKNE